MKKRHRTKEGRARGGARGGGGGTFGARESEERAVRAGELEEHAENEPGLEQLHSAECAPVACARAGLRVHVSVPALNERGTVHGRVFGAVRAVRIPSRGYSKCSNWTLSTRKGYTKYSHWVH